MARLNLVQAIDQALLQEMEADDQVVVLGEDVGRDGGVFRVTEGLVERFGEERVIDTPLAESGIVGVSIGMALAGYRPVVEIQFSGFSYPAYDQLVSHASRMRNRSRGRWTVPMVVRMPYGGGIRALEHHSESMEAVFAHVPGVEGGDSLRSIRGQGSPGRRHRRSGSGHIHGTQAYLQGGEDGCLLYTSDAAD